MMIRHNQNPMMRMLKRAGVRLAVATANKAPLFRPALENCGVLELFDAIARREVPIRRLSIDFPGVVGEQNQGYDFFTDWDAVEREKQREKAVLALTEKYGRNAVLRGTNFLEGATQRERNEMIGGHRAGYDETGTGKAIHALRRDEGLAGGAAGPGGTPHEGGTP